MQITYREMRTADKPSIIKMFYDFCEIYKQLDLQKISVNSQEYAQWCLKDMLEEINTYKGKVIVATDKESVIGFIGFFARSAKGDELYYHRPHTFGVVYDLYVHEAYRNHEVGTHLLKISEEYFKEHHCEFSKLQVFGTNTDAIRFYERHDYKTRNIDLIKKL